MKLTPRLAALARDHDVVYAIDEMRAAAMNDAERRIMALGYSGPEAVLLFGAALSRLVNATSAERLLAVACDPDTALPELDILPTNVTPFPAPLWPR